MVSIEAALKVPGYMSRRELAWLAERAAAARVVVEIGSSKGRSTRALGDAVRGRVFAVDTWIFNGQAFYLEFLRHMEDLVKAQRVVPIPWDSQKGVPPELEGVAVDLLFVDADHAYQACRNDIINFSPLVRDGGIISGHDYNSIPRHAGVRKAVDEIFGTRRVNHLSSIWWLVKKGGSRGHT